MMIDKLTSCFEQKGYQRLDTNAQGIHLYYRMDYDRLFVISLLIAESGDELTPQQYYHILKQVKDNFLSWQANSREFLGLIATHQPDKLKGIYTDLVDDTHWMADLRKGRLLIYENQPMEFDGLREPLELILEEERRQDDHDLLNQVNQSIQPENVSKTGLRKVLSPINTVIVALNVIAFIILHYSGLLGGLENRMEAGGIAWYYVKQGEYYRFLTSMFMHGDWDHLFNNMLVLIFIGDNLERAAGKFKYLLIYFASGILADITSISYNMWKDNGIMTEQSSFSIGASGAIFGVVGAVLLIVIVNRGRLEDMDISRMILFVILSLYGGFANAGIDNAAHVGGFLSGILLAALLYRRPKERESLFEPEQSDAGGEVVP